MRSRNQLLRKVKMPHGISLRLVDGLYVEERVLVYERDVLGKIEGLDYFLGGYLYSGISLTAANALIASGYEPVEE